MGKFQKVFRKLCDPRAANARHELWQVLFIALAAVLGGAKSCSEMALFGRSKEDLFCEILGLQHGIPSHDTFSRVFRLLDPDAFEKAFQRFMAAFAKANRIDLSGVLAIDGKALRGAYERGKAATPLHMVNVFAAEARMALASCKAPGRNEAKGALRLLGMLSIEGSIVTTDALHCSRPFATAVLARKANYALALKKNQGKLFDGVARRFARRGKRSTAVQRETSVHDRRETRRATVIRDTKLGVANHFPGVEALARITSRRRLQGKRAERPLVRYFLLSRYMPAKKVLQVLRSHWGIENRLHWVLDVVMAEDANRARKDNAPENLAILRRLALNIIRNHPAKTSLQEKIKRAGWENTFLLDVLSHMR
jgi:predicted transposase YbfD/YdcC